MDYQVGTFGAFPMDIARDERDAATIYDIIAKVRDWSAEAPHARAAFKKMLRYAMAVWENDRHPGEKIWRLGYSGIPWSPTAHAIVSTTPSSRPNRYSFLFDGKASTGGRLTLEHVVPSSVIQSKLEQDRCVSDVIGTFRDSYRVAVLTQEEGLAVRPRNAMPAGWDGTDNWARYRLARKKGRIDFDVEDMLVGPTFHEMRPLREWLQVRRADSDLPA